MSNKIRALAYRVAVPAAVILFAAQAKAEEFDTLSATDVKDVVAANYNEGKTAFLLIIGALLAAGLLMQLIFWGYHKVKGMFRAKKKV